MHGVGEITAGQLNPDLIGALSNIIVHGQAGLGTSTETSNRQVLSVSLAGTKTILNNTAEANSSKILNLVSKKAAQLCPKYEASPSTQNSVICQQGHLEINQNNINNLQGKDIIVSGGHVSIDVSVFNNLQKPFSLYITKGNLYLQGIDHNTIPQLLTNFDSNGFAITS